MKTSELQQNQLKMKENPLNLKNKTKSSIYFEYNELNYITKQFNYTITSK